MSGLLRNLEVSELRSFCTAADLGSVGRAALRLSISQPALSKRLQALERAAGVALLDRSPRGVTLTPAGRRLYTEARRLVEQAEVVEGLMAGLARAAGPLRVAASHSATEAIVAGALAGAEGVELLTANSQVVRALVAEGRADLGVAAGRPAATPNPAVRKLHLAEDEIVCGVPRGHPWAQRRRISRAEFIRTPMVLRDAGSKRPLDRRGGARTRRPARRRPTGRVPDARQRASGGPCPQRPAAALPPRAAQRALRRDPGRRAALPACL